MIRRRSAKITEDFSDDGIAYTAVNPALEDILRTLNKTFPGEMGPSLADLYRTTIALHSGSAVEA